MPARPPVSIVLPFHGTPADADAALDALAAVRRGPGDEIVVADNTPGGAVAERPDVRVLRTRVKRSVYTARNEGVRAARNDWLLFVDADCRPEPGLLDAYFTPVPPDDAGAVAGAVVAARGQATFVARYVASRGHLDQAYNVHRHPYAPMAVTANLLVRRAAFDQVGGFAEGTRSGADAELCWRLQDAGWRLVLNEAARVEHVHRDRLAPLLRQAARDGAASAWLDRRRPGSGARARLGRELARAVAGAAWWTARGQPERAAFKAMDGLWSVALNVGYLAGNAPPRAGEGPRAERVVLAGEYPRPGQGAPEPGTRVEALRRPERPDWSLVEGADVRWAEDAGTASRMAALAWLAVRPRRWRRPPPGWRAGDLAVALRRTARDGLTDAAVVSDAGR